MQSCSVQNTIIVERDVETTTGYRVEKEIKPYVDEFNRICKIKSDTNVRFGLLEGDTVGLCIYDFFNSNVIIDESAWESYSHNKREVLVFHELGHCVLNRGHNKKKTNGRPESIMYPYVLNGYSYFNHRDVYLKELCD